MICSNETHAMSALRLGMTNILDDKIKKTLHKVVIIEDLSCKKLFC
jgi:hypothetical protein